MNILRLILPLLASLLVVCSCTGATSTPDALAKALQRALDNGDFKAAAALADLANAPAEVHFALLDNVYECSTDAKCTVAAAPIDAAFRQQLADDAKQLGAEVPAAEGLIVVTSKSKDGSGSGTLQMPYAKVDGTYKLASLHLGAAEIAKRRATTGEQLLKEMFAGGIYDNASGERRMDWATAATPLPADGGNAGVELVRQTSAMAKAVDAKDPDAAMAAGGQWAKVVFADKGYDGKPIAREQRQKKLYVQPLRMLRDVKVTGGYALGDDAALIVEGRDGIGWTERGAVLMTRNGDVWDVSGKQLIAYPD
jgi:hypothetical protein